MVSIMSAKSEEEFLALIDEYFPGQGSGLLLGRGDDCAVLQCRDRLCVSSDFFLEGVHFSRDYFSPQDIGHKGLAANLSDIAAMGATPEGFLLNLLLPQDLPEDFWPQYFRGLADLAGEYGIYLAGGDLSRSRQLGIGITIWGTPGQRYLTRGNCSAGDLLFLLGQPGLSATGLEVLGSGKNTSEFPQAIQAHLRPSVFVDQARRLEAVPQVKALMDVSDGLAKDVPRFLSPGLGADLWLSEQDLHPEVVAHAEQEGMTAVDFAFRGGEEYALLGALAPFFRCDLNSVLPGARIIGRVTRDPGIRLNGEAVPEGGYDHLRG